MAEDRSHDGKESGSRKRMLGGFEIVREIGRGAMGTVFEGRQVSVNRAVAIKVLPPQLAVNPQYVERFLREARAAAELNHSNIVQAIDAGHASGFYYFVMEFVDGPSVEDLLVEQGHLPEKRALEVVRDVARALDHAHTRAGLLHRDVKPANILLSDDGTAKLADLGLARHQAGSGAATSLTLAGAALGTPDYISPEQAQGEKDLGIRTDIYSLGATLYHLVCGHPPYSGKSATDIMAQHMRDPLPNPRERNPELSVGVCSIIRKAMAKKRDRRYATPGAMLEDVERLLAGGRVPLVRAERDGTSRTRPHRPKRRKRKVGRMIGIGAGLIVLAVLTAVLVPRPSDAPAPAEPVVTDEPTPAEEPTVPDDGRRLYEFVSEWVREHPDEYDEGLRRLEEAKAATEDAVLRMKIDDAMAGVRRRRSEAADAAFAGLQARAGELAGQNDIDGAIAVYAEVPAPYRDLLEMRSDAEVARLRHDAEQTIRAAMDAAQDLSDGGDTAGALAALDGIAGIRYTALSEEIATLRAQIEEAGRDLEEMARRRALAEAKKAIEELLAAIEAAAGSGELAEAARLAEEADADETYRPASDQLEPVVAVGKALGRAAEFAGADPAAILSRRVGDEVSLRSGEHGSVRGSVTRVTEDTVVLTRTFWAMGEERSREYVIDIADLTPETVAELRPDWEPETPDEQIAAAILAVASEDADAVEAALNAAPDHPLRERYTAELGRLRLGAAEYAARAAWSQIEPLAAKPELALREAAAVVSFLDEYEEAHGGTEFAESKVEEIARLRRSPAEARAAEAWRTIGRYATAADLTEDRAQSLANALDTFEEAHGGTEFAESKAEDIAELRDHIRPHLPEIRFDSELDLRVKVVLFDEHSRPRGDGRFRRTPTEDGAGVTIPGGTLWTVGPGYWSAGERRKLTDRDIAPVIREVKAREIPGLDLRNCTQITDAGIAEIRTLTHLRVLNLATCRRLTNDGLEALRPLGNLVYLSLNYVDFDGRILSSFPKLRYLVCQNNREGTVMSHIGELGELRYLDLRGARDEGMRHLAGLRNLESVRLHFGWATPGAGLQHLKGNPNLRYLSFSSVRNRPITEEGMSAVGELESLRVLIGNVGSSNSLRHLRNLRNLERLSLPDSKNVDDSAIQHLKQLPKLQHVNLKGTSVTERGARELEAAIEGITVER